MTLPIYRLRRILAATAILLSMVVAGMYFYARSRVRNILGEVHGKIGLDIKQTVNGFQISKSDGKRTLFTVQAKDVKEFKLNGHAELHNVMIVLYGRDSSRYDKIYGDDFAYDQKTGDVTAKGDVQIDLVANPTGLASPDQSTPKDLKNPIHLKTRDLVFNKDSGNAWTDARVEFSTPQATGSALGVKYAGTSGTLTLTSQIHIAMEGTYEGTVEAEHGIITNDLRSNALRSNGPRVDQPKDDDSRSNDPQDDQPRQIVLDHPFLRRAAGTLKSDQATFFLGADNNVERVLAEGNVNSETQTVQHKGLPNKPSVPPAPASQIHSRSDQAEFLLTAKGNLLRTAILSGNVHVQETGAQAAEGDAGRLILDFAGKNELQAVHAVDGARLTQKSEAAAADTPAAKNATGSSGPQDFELTAPVIDFTVSDGHVLDRAVTSGAAQITILPAKQSAASAAASPAQKTVVTAGKFDAKFSAADDGRNHLASVHGAPDSRVVTSTAGKPDQVSTGDAIDATFLPQGGIDSIIQSGNVAYTDNQSPDKRMQAWASNARYNPADQILTLNGSPRVVSGSSATTAKTIRINRATGDAAADTDVKTTYSEVKEQPDGALLASSSPIHVTARNMTVHNSPGSPIIALYSGEARLWQDANVIEAPTIQFDRDHRFVTAQGTVAQPVQTILVQTQKAQADHAQAGKSTTAGGAGGKIVASSRSNQSNPITITAMQLTYADSERKAHYDGGVIAKGADFSATAKTADAYLMPHSAAGGAGGGQAHGSQSLTGSGQLDRMVAQGDVVIQQPNRRANGQKLVYTAADDKFVITGGPPSIFDAEQGKITGVSLTFFRRDDRVLVEGEASTPVVTQTRVAR
jgi:lipopolysaccharide export system protein LptA